MAILFVGNSHTANHDVPALVETLLESDPGVEANVLRLGSSFLRDAVANPRVIAEIESGAWDVVVLQGQEISQSHTIVYSRSEAISLAEMAIAAGSRPLFFAEWSRRGIDETDYIEAIYAAIAETAGAEVIPVGRTWDHFLDDYPDHELWAPDGNHASEDGAFLAAATIASFIAGPDATISVEPGREAMLTTAQDVVAER